MFLTTSITTYLCFMWSQSSKLNIRQKIPNLLPTNTAISCKWSSSQQTHFSTERQSFKFQSKTHHNIYSGEQSNSFPNTNHWSWEEVDSTLNVFDSDAATDIGFGWLDPHLPKQVHRACNNQDTLFPCNTTGHRACNNKDTFFPVAQQVTGHSL